MKINQTQLDVIPSFTPFDFESTACSHGWVDLAPNLWNKENRSVQRVQCLRSGKVVLLDIRGGGSEKRPKIVVDVSHQRKLTQAEQDEIRSIAGRMFRVDEDLSEFYALCKRKGKRWHPVTAGLGRMLRSPSVFEDVVKTISTVNIQWGGTKGMVRRLVDTYGVPCPGDPDKKAFPAPEAIASSTEKEFNESVRMGFRNNFVYTLAQRVAGGELDLERFVDSDMPTSALKKELKKIKGVGDYAAANMLMLLGRYDELTIDTVCRSFVGKTYYKGNTPTDNEILKIYDKWGQWKFLAYWFDLWQAYNKPAA